jgi:hypothetical protein
MVIDYRDVCQAVRTRQALEEAGVAVHYTPNKLISVSLDPAATQWIVHRLEVPAAESTRARAILDESNLWPRQGADAPS